jgi:hypothetical protein
MNPYLEAVVESLLIDSIICPGRSSSKVEFVDNLVLEGVVNSGDNCSGAGFMSPMSQSFSKDSHTVDGGGLLFLSGAMKPNSERLSKQSSLDIRLNDLLGGDSFGLTSPLSQQIAT